MSPMPSPCGSELRTLLRTFGHHGLGRDQQASHRRGVLQRDPHDLGGIDNAGGDQVLVLTDCAS